MKEATERERATIYRKMGQRPERIEILWACGCDGDKIRHHYDYDKPYSVFLLCHSCHGKEHHKPANKPRGKYSRRVSRIEILDVIEHNGTVYKVGENGIDRIVTYDDAKYVGVYKYGAMFKRLDKIELMTGGAVPFKAQLLGK